MNYSDVFMAFVISPDKQLDQCNEHEHCDGEDALWSRR